MRRALINSRSMNVSFPGRSFVVLAACAALYAAAAAPGQVVPTNGMVITTNTTFVPGVYNLPDGVSIGASGITLDMNGAELVGFGGVTYGVTCLGYDNVTISNCEIRVLENGIDVHSGRGHLFENNNFSFCEKGIVAALSPLVVRRPISRTSTRIPAVG